jgi:hypothetical protein
MNDEFIKSEMMAESYLDDISLIKKLMKDNNFEQCMTEIEKLESKMRVTLAIGEKYDLQGFHDIH